MRTIFFVALLLIATASAPPRGHAQESSEYKNLIKQAVAEFDMGNWVEARVLFQRAHAINPNARTWRSLGLTAYELRKYVDAIAELEAALADRRKPLDDKARAEVQELLARAREFVAVYRVKIQPPDAEVLVDGQPAFLKDNQLLLDPGSHTVVVRAPGYLEERKDLRILEPRRDELSIELQMANRASDDETTEATEGFSPRQKTSPAVDAAPRRRLWTWVLGGAAVASGATALGLGIAANGKHDEFVQCEANCQNLRDKGQGLQLGANITSGLAGALLVGSVVAFFLEGKSSKDTPKTSFYLHRHGFGVQGAF